MCLESPASQHLWLTPVHTETRTHGAERSTSGPSLHLLACLCSAPRPGPEAPTPCPLPADCEGLAGSAPCWAGKVGSDGERAASSNLLLNPCAALLAPAQLPPACRLRRPPALLRGGRLVVPGRGVEGQAMIRWPAGFSRLGGPWAGLESGRAWGGQAEAGLRRGGRDGGSGHVPLCGQTAA